MVQAQPQGSHGEQRAVGQRSDPVTGQFWRPSCQPWVDKLLVWAELLCLRGT